MSTARLQSDIKLRYAAFACFASTTLVFSPNTSIFTGIAADGAAMGGFIFPMFVAAVLCAGGFAAFFRTHGQASRKAIPALIGVAAVQLLTAGAFVALMYGIALPPAAVGAAGALYGASLVVMCLAWSRILGSVGFRRALLYCALVCIASFAISITLGHLPVSVRWAAYLLVLSAGAVMPVIALRGGHATNSMGDAPDGNSAAAATEEDAPEAQASPTAELLSTLRLPIAGLLLFAFMMAISKSRTFGVETEYFTGIVACLLMLPLFALHTEKPFASLVHRVIAPTVGGLVVVLLAIPSQGGTHTVAIMCVYVFLSALAVFAFANILAIINARELSAEFVTSLGLAGGCLASLAGLVWSQMFGGPEDTEQVIMLLIALYCAFMMVYLGWQSWSLVSRPEEARPPQAAAQSDWQQRAEEAGLTKRETEILAYLGRGHSIIFIAEKLFISESTVRTHVKHIYAKLGIHSKEELFDFVDGKTSA